MRPSILASLILFGVGTLFLIAGGILRVAVDPGQEAARVSALPLATATSWKSFALGTEVLVEGRIASTTPVRFREFVACRRERYAGKQTSGTSKGQDRWETVETVTPSLGLDASGGSVAITNDAWELRGPCHQWFEDDQLFQTKREAAFGFQAGDGIGGLLGLIGGLVAWLGRR